MYSLLIDTHDKDVLLVLYKDGKVQDKICKESNMRHSEITMPSLIELLEKNSVNIRDIDEIFVIVGPGSFTGVRIGVVIAKTISYLVKVPIKCMLSTDLLYYSDDLNSGIYGISENNGFFVAEYNGVSLKCLNVKYYSTKDYNEKYNNKEVLLDVELNLENIYKYASNLENTDSHLVNPVYVKQIEALK